MRSSIIYSISSRESWKQRGVCVLELGCCCYWSEDIPKDLIQPSKNLSSLFPRFSLLMHLTALYGVEGALGPLMLSLIPDGKDLWKRRSWRRWIHKTSLNAEQTGSANRYFFFPQGLRVFYKYKPRAECTQRSQQSVLCVDPSTKHSARKIVKKTLNEPKICLELEIKSCVIIPSQ